MQDIGESCKVNHGLPDEIRFARPNWAGVGAKIKTRWVGVEGGCSWDWQAESAPNLDSSVLYIGEEKNKKDGLLFVKFTSNFPLSTKLNKKKIFSFQHNYR